MTISDIKALQKWREIPVEFRKRILQNVFCGTCGATTIVDYAINDGKHGIELHGKCKTCDKMVTRVVED